MRCDHSYVRWPLGSWQLPPAHSLDALGRRLMVFPDVVLEEENWVTEAGAPTPYNLCLGSLLSEEILMVLTRLVIGKSQGSGMQLGHVV